MSKNRTETQGEMTELSATAQRLLDEAKRIQQEVIHLPVLKRQNAMNQVIALEQAAVREAQKSSASATHSTIIERT